jgi:hypothetical protein
MQLAFSDIIVGPYFDALTEIFPRILNISDMVVANSDEWNSLLPPAALERKNKTVKNAEVVRGTKEVKRSNTQSHTYTGMKKGFNHSFSDSIDLRKMSLAPGTIEVPENVKKYLATVSADGKKNSASISVGIRRLSMARSQVVIKRDQSFKNMEGRSRFSEDDESDTLRTPLSAKREQSFRLPEGEPRLTEDDELDQLKRIPFTESPGANSSLQTPTSAVELGKSEGA